MFILHVTEQIIFPRKRRFTNTTFNSKDSVGYTETCALYTCFWIAYTETCVSKNWKNGFFPKKGIFFTKKISQNSKMYILIRMWKKFFKKFIFHQVQNVSKHFKKCWKMTVLKNFFIFWVINTFLNFEKHF